MNIPVPMSAVKRTCHSFSPADVNLATEKYELVALLYSLRSVACKNKAMIFPASSYSTLDAKATVSIILLDSAESKVCIQMLGFTSMLPNTESPFESKMSPPTGSVKLPVRPNVQWLSLARTMMLSGSSMLVSENMLVSKLLLPIDHDPLPFTLR